MSTYTDTDTESEETLIQLNGLIASLNTQLMRSPTVSLQSGYADRSPAPKNCESAIQPTHCLRTVSQRSLSCPVTFLSDPVHVAGTADVFAALVTGVTGCLPGVGLGGVAPIEFNDANVQAQRQRVDELVFWGARAKVSVMAVAGDGGVILPFNLGLYAQSIADFIKDYVVFRTYATSDVNEPWIDSTPLRYFDRPGGDFVAVPPVLWKDRDPVMQLDVRVADFGAGAGALPTVQLGTIDLDAQCSILFETLWIPNPDYCGEYWPGSSCPKEHVHGVPGYKGR